MTSLTTYAHVLDVDTKLTHVDSVAATKQVAAHVQLTLTPHHGTGEQTITLFVYGDTYADVDDILSKLGRQFTEHASEVAREGREHGHALATTDEDPPTGDEPTTEDLEDYYEGASDGYDGAHEASYRRNTFDGAPPDPTTYCVTCRQPDTTLGHGWTRGGLQARLICNRRPVYTIDGPPAEVERVIAEGWIDGKTGRLRLDN